MNTNNLTKQQVHALTTILSNLRRASNYLNRPEVVGIAESLDEKNANGADYKLVNPEASKVCLDSPVYVRRMNCHIGSDIVGLSMALNQLDQFLNPPASTLI